MKPVNPRDTSVHLIATVQAKPGKRTELLDALAALVDASIAEAGCLQYALHVEPERPGVFVFYEAWQNQAALDEHMASTHFQPFVAISGALIEGTTDIRKLTRTR